MLASNVIIDSAEANSEQAISVFLLPSTNHHLPTNITFARMINVTRTYLPPLEQYEKYLKELWDNRWVTNNGKFVQQLEADIKNYLGVKHFFYCTNGTV